MRTVDQPDPLTSAPLGPALERKQPEINIAPKPLKEHPRIWIKPDGKWFTTDGQKVSPE